MAKGPEYPWDTPPKEDMPEPRELLPDEKEGQEKAWRADLGPKSGEEMTNSPFETLEGLEERRMERRAQVDSIDRKFRNEMKTGIQPGTFDQLGGREAARKELIQAINDTLRFDQEIISMLEGQPGSAARIAELQKEQENLEILRESHEGQL